MTGVQTCALPISPGRAENILYTTGYLIAGAVMISFFHLVFSNLVSSSNINFESYRVLELSWFSIVGFVAVLLLLLVPVFFVFKVFSNAGSQKVHVVILSAGLSLTALFLFFHDDLTTLFTMALFWLAVSLGIWISVRQNAGLFNTIAILALITGIYSLRFITILSDEKTTRNLKIQAVSFSTENDPEAEHLLLDTWSLISADTLLRDMMSAESFNKDREDVDRIRDHINDTYFGGYWGNYNFNIVLCSNEELLRIGTGRSIMENCFGFFDTRIRMNGHRLTGTEFYFIDSQGGRAYYLGRLYFDAGKGITNGLFIELYSDVNIFQPGYSELLLDKKYHKYAGLKDYSFSKYINGEIVLRSGEFPYDKTDAEIGRAHV